MIYFLLFFQLWAQPVLVQSVDSNEVEYEKHLLTNPQVQSFIQWQKQKKLASEHELLALLKKAQFEFLKGSLALAKSHFKEIADMAHREDWQIKHRKTIHYALLRWSQLEKDINKKRNLVKRALVFDPTLPMDTQLFPPPMVKQFKNLLTNQKAKIWALPKNAEQYSSILVNGRLVSGNSGFIKMSPGTRRITFLSNKYSPATYTTAMENLESLDIISTALVRGDCKNPTFHNTFSGDQAVQGFHSGCLSQSSARSQETIAMQSSPPSPSKEKSPQFYKNKWFWIGVSIVASGFAIHRYNQSQQSTPPQVQSAAASQPPQGPVVLSNQ